MKDEFALFLEEPTGENLLAVRRAMRRGSRGQAGAIDLAELSRLLEGGLWRRLQEQIQKLPASAWLSPRVHFYAAVAAEQLGDDEDAEVERLMLAACLKGLLETGDGSAEAPYLVGHAADEHDILETLGLTPVTQSLVQDGPRRLDVVDCQDGSEIWFDVTDLFPPVRERLRRRPSAPSRKKSAAR